MAQISSVSPEIQSNSIIWLLWDPASHHGSSHAWNWSRKEARKTPPLGTRATHLPLSFSFVRWLSTRWREREGEKTRSKITTLASFCFTRWFVVRDDSIDKKDRRCKQTRTRSFVYVRLEWSSMPVEDNENYNYDHNIIYT